MNRWLLQQSLVGAAHEQANHRDRAAGLGRCMSIDTCTTQYAWFDNLHFDISGSSAAINGSRGYITGPNFPQLVITPYTEANSTAEISSE
jgi:hypothetical protein